MSVHDIQLHTHFILVDHQHHFRTGEQSEWGVEVAFRGMLESMLAGREAPRPAATERLEQLAPGPGRRGLQAVVAVAAFRRASQSPAEPLPLTAANGPIRPDHRSTPQLLRTKEVLMVISGGYQTLRTIRDATQTNVPVVVFRRTGRIADMMCELVDGYQRLLQRPPRMFSKEEIQLFYTVDRPFEELPMVTHDTLAGLRQAVMDHFRFPEELQDGFRALGENVCTVRRWSVWGSRIGGGLA